MDDDNFNSVSTKLLTLLNVSATRRDKKRRPNDDIKPPGKRITLGGKPKAVFSTTVVSSTFVARAIDGQIDSKPDADIDEALEDDLEVADVKDPFNDHFGAKQSSLSPSALNALDEGKWTTRQRKIGSLGAFQELLLLDNASEVQLSAKVSSAESAKLLASFKSRLDTLNDEMRSLCADFAKLAGTYEDVFVSDRDGRKQQAFREAISVHALNHNNDRLAHFDEAAGGDPPSDVQDQGFTRPKVLFLLPLRNSALSWIETLISNSPTSQTENHSHFLAEYSLPKGVSDRLAENPENYPRDHVDNFEGNIDDNFRLGLKLTRKTMKLFTEFYSSDMIVASPLSMKMLIEKDKSKSADFLSSIEILVVDQLDVMSMQNWEHLQFVLGHINKLPNETRDSDFSRIKPWYLDGHAAKLRQTLLFSPYETAEMRALYKSLTNVAGKLKTEQRFTGLLTQLPKGIQQTFMKFSCSSPLQEADARFEYFTKQVMPSLLKSAVRSVNTMIFVPSYFDYVRLRNHFKDTGAISYTTLSEDVSNSEIARARQQFFAGNKAFVIMTERFHFYRRYRIRGFKNITFYGLPDHGNYYDELLAMPFQDAEDTEGSDLFVQAIFCQYDFLRLERIVGTQDARKMIKSQEDVFTFV
ncbi:digestive organ expansion factor [Dacryopinax primogenitus]|uniref:U3 small nucleolar RNA-associated protein 25 n=1 Tax=Dacryopinax primogenitus (strain DJM 731) TaxID=1858805 RepID=M5G5K7_DACPD|nr:digestive organ expansion factor [Dacryopinax primogenitus]EJT99042.1 digestive organ expansion factor [Dacryopinax primogenitus]